MELLSCHNNCPPYAKNSVLVIGNFDGVHLGHQHLIKMALHIADEKVKSTFTNKKGLSKGLSNIANTNETEQRDKTKNPSDFQKTSSLNIAIMTFEPHPSVVIKPEQHFFRLCDNATKLSIFDKLGVKFVFTINFTQNFASIEAEEFIDKILLKNLEINHVVVGYDFIFGKNGRGNGKMLQDKLTESNVTIIDAFKFGDLTPSSSLVRELIKKGNVKQANKILGYEFSVHSKVVKGQQKGRGLGFPTANLQLGSIIRPQYGVYAVKAIIDDNEFAAIANIGIRPTFADNIEFLEVHIFDFCEDIYDKVIKVKFIDFIRVEQKFDNIGDLRVQIAKDCQIAKEILS